MKRTLSLVGCLLAAPALIALFEGCASLAPGADPVVVRAEQVETIAQSTLNLVVQEDQANRGFWMTNAPAFHSFAEWLRAPMPVDGTNLPRGLAIIKQLDDVKLSYKAGAATSNQVETVITTLQTALTQASAWLTIASNSPSH